MGPAILEQMRSGVWILLLCALSYGQAPTPDQLFHEAVAAQKSGDTKLAIEKYQELLKLRPDVPEVRANLGAALAHEGRFDEAIQQYRAALEKAPDNSQLRLNLALAYYKKGDTTSAAAQLTLLHGAQPGNVQIAILLGDCYTRAGRFADAVTLLQPVQQEHPEDLGVKWTLGVALIRTGKLQPGLDLVQQVAQQGKSAEAYQLAAETYLNMNEFERGEACASEALKLDSNLPGLHTLDGRLKHYLGDYTGAKAELAKALQQNPDDFQAHLTLGAILNGERDLSGAQEHIEHALKIQPDSPMARYEMGRVERSRGNIEAAVREFEFVEHALPDWLRPHVELATLYYKMNRAADGEKERATVERLQKGAVAQPPEPPDASGHSPSP